MNGTAKAASAVWSSRSASLVGDAVPERLVCLESQLKWLETALRTKGTSDAFSPADWLALVTTCDALADSACQLAEAYEKMQRSSGVSAGGDGRCVPGKVRHGPPDEKVLLAIQSEAAKASEDIVDRFPSLTQFDVSLRQHKSRVTLRIAYASASNGNVARLFSAEIAPPFGGSEVQAVFRALEATMTGGTQRSEPREELACARHPAPT